MKRGRLAMVAIAGMSVVLSGCGREDAARRVATCRSWMATALMVAEAWKRGEVPAAYATRLLRTAAIEMNCPPAGETPGLPSPRIRDAALAALQAGIEHGDEAKLAEGLSAVRSWLTRRARGDR